MLSLEAKFVIGKTPLATEWCWVKSFYEHAANLELYSSIGQYDVYNISRLIHVYGRENRTTRIRHAPITRRINNCEEKSS